MGEGGGRGGGDGGREREREREREASQLDICSGGTNNHRKNNNCFYKGEYVNAS
jgi:hypothetical protein